MLITPEGGGEPFYAKITMADNPTEPGTPNNKANLLSDATAAALAAWAATTLSANPTVNEVLAKIAATKPWKLLQTYNTPGAFTFTVPAGVIKLGVLAIGGGGSGGAIARRTSNSTQATGGGSGQLIQRVVSVTPGQTISGSIGPGGAARVAQSSGGSTELGESLEG